MWVDSINVEVVLGGGFAADSRRAAEGRTRIESDLKKRRLCARCPCQVPQWVAGGRMGGATVCADVTPLYFSTSLLDPLYVE